MALAGRRDSFALQLVGDRIGDFEGGHIGNRPDDLAGRLPGITAGFPAVDRVRRW